MNMETRPRMIQWLSNSWVFYLIAMELSPSLACLPWIFLFSSH